MQARRVHRVILSSVVPRPQRTQREVRHPDCVRRWCSRSQAKGGPQLLLEPQPHLGRSPRASSVCQGAPMCTII